MTKSSRQAQQRQLEAKKKKQQQYLLIGGGALAVILLLAGAYFALVPRAPAPTSTGSAVCDAVQQLPDEGRSHLNPGDPTPVYQSNPPTSGTHNPVPLPAGVYGNNVDITQLVHSLEHGYVILWYNGVSKDEVQQLINIQQSDPTKVIVAPDPNMPHKISITSWTRMQNCDGVNEGVIRSFIAQFRGQGPEPFSQ